MRSAIFDRMRRAIDATADMSGPAVSKEMTTERRVKKIAPK
jgi:hypothetical protein